MQLVDRRIVSGPGARQLTVLMTLYPASAMAEASAFSNPAVMSRNSRCSARIVDSCSIGPCATSRKLHFSGINTFVLQMATKDVALFIETEMLAYSIEWR